MHNQVASGPVVVGKLGTKSKRKINKIMGQIKRQNRRADKPIIPHRVFVTRSVIKAAMDPLDVILENSNLRIAISY